MEGGQHKICDADVTRETLTTTRRAAFHGTYWQELAPRQSRSALQ